MADIQGIIERASRDEGLARANVELLLSFGAESAEAQLMNAAAKELAMRAAQDEGRIYAQIGVDALPCPENCRFCSFAACNVQGQDMRDAIMPLDAVVSYARIFADAGCDLISLMATAALPFSTFLEMASAVAEVAEGRALIMANVGDMTLSQAEALRSAGIDAAYHALRIGEGVITDIQPEQRLDSIQNTKAAGLKLMSGVEPLYEGMDQNELGDAILLQRELHPFCTGSCPLTVAEGTLMEGVQPASRARVRQVSSIIRLVCGLTVPYGAGGGIQWVDAGADPRDRGYGCDEDHLRRQVRDKRALLAEAGWK